MKEGSKTYPCVASSHAFNGGITIQDEQRFECPVEASGTSSRSLIAQVVSTYGDTTRSSLYVTIQRGSPISAPQHGGFQGCGAERPRGWGGEDPGI